MSEYIIVRDKDDGKESLYQSWEELARELAEICKIEIVGETDGVSDDI